MLAILLLDENISPRIIPSLWQQQVDAVHIRDRGLLAAPDHALWTFAQSEGRTIVTINARHFRKLARHDASHHGLVVIPSGGSPNAQFEFIMAAVRWVAVTNSDAGFANRYLEIGESGEIVVTEVL